MGRGRDKIIIGVILVSALVFSIFAFLILISIAGDSSGFPIDGYSFSGRVAIIDVKGVIEYSDDVVRQLNKYEDDSSVKALIMRIDTPGGGVAASQEIYDRVLEFKKSGKPVIASMGAIAASGGYYVACAADTIIANPGTLTGSIGVIFSFMTFEKLMETVGMELEVIKSGKLKDVGNYSRKVTPAERKMLQAAIDDTYDQFINVVADSRGMDIEDVRAVSDGSIFTGRQAMEKGLVDILGTFEDAISIAGELADIGDDPNTVQERPRRRSLWADYAKDILGLGNGLLSDRTWPYIEYRYSY